MQGIRSRASWLSVVSLVCLTFAGSSLADPRTSHRKAAKAAEPVVQPAPPPVPLTLEQMPAIPPQVTFQNGQLTIAAPNSTLGDILRAVHAQTGALVDVPPNATERVVGQIGPGPASDVLASLLKGSHFNYVMLGSPNDPSKLDRVILTAKTGDAGGSTPATPVQASMQPVQPVYPMPASVPPPQGQVQQADDSQDNSDDMTDDASDQTEDADQGDAAQAEDVQTQQQQPNAAPNIKTPEQLLQELQRQQQLQQQGQPGQPNPQGFPPATATPTQPPPN